jgi:hypothetical protein
MAIMKIIIMIIIINIGENVKKKELLYIVDCW